MIAKRLAQTEVWNPHAMHGYVTWPQLPFCSPQSLHNSLASLRTSQSRGLNPGPIVRRIQSFSSPTIRNASGQRKATANMTASAVHVTTHSNYKNFWLSSIFCELSNAVSCTLHWSTTHRHRPIWPLYQGKSLHSFCPRTLTCMLHTYRITRSPSCFIFPNNSFCMTFQWLHDHTSASVWMCACDFRGIHMTETCQHHANTSSGMSNPGQLLTWWPPVPSAGSSSTNSYARPCRWRSLTSSISWDACDLAHWLGGHYYRPYIMQKQSWLAWGILSLSLQHSYQPWWFQKKNVFTAWYYHHSLGNTPLWWKRSAVNAMSRVHHNYSSYFWVGKKMLHGWETTCAYQILLASNV